MSMFGREKAQPQAHIKRLVRQQYMAYLAQFEKPKYRFSNPYNLFYNWNYRDRHSLTQVRRRLKRLVSGKRYTIR